MLIRYGGRRVTAEEKIVNLLRTCLAFSHLHKIRLFLKFMGIIVEDPFEYGRNNFDFYLDCLAKLDDPNVSSIPGAG